MFTARAIIAIRNHETKIDLLSVEIAGQLLAYPGEDRLFQGVSTVDEYLPTRF